MDQTEKKQQYLFDQIINQGFNAEDFQNYMSSIKDNGFFF